MGAESVYLKTVVRGLKGHYSQAEDTEKIIITAASVAAGASAVGGVIPVLAIPGMIVSCFGAVWVMYAKICTCLGLNLKEGLLKILARAALANIVANLAGAFAAEIVFAFVPGASVIAGAALTFCTVYLAGLIFLKTILSLAKKGKSGAALNHLSDSEFENILKEQKVDKSNLKDAKNAYKNDKQN